MAEIFIVVCSRVHFCTLRHYHERIRGKPCEKKGEYNSVRKSSRKQKLLAVDPSLSASGWALFDLGQSQRDCPRGRQETLPLAVGVIRPPGPRTEMSERLDHLQRQIEQLLRQLELAAGDVLVCEGPAPLVLNPDTSMKVERVRGIFETVGRGAGLLVPGRLNPRTVQTELLGMRGPQLERQKVKAWARETARVLFGPALFSLPLTTGSNSRKHGMPQDVIDAVLIGVLAAAKVRLCQQSGLPLSAMFAAAQSGRRAARSCSPSRSPSRRSGAAWTEAQVRRLRAAR